MPARLGALDYWMFAAVLGLVGIGLLANYSTSIAEGEVAFTHFDRQLLWSAMGFIAMLTAMSLPAKFLRSLAYVAYVVGVLGLLAVFVAGDVQMGARRWISFGPFQAQPSELAKMTVLLGLARFLTDFPRDVGKSWVTVTAIGIALVPMGLIAAEPDLGTSLLFPMLLFMMLAWGGIPLWHLLIILTPVIAVLTSWILVLHAIVLLTLLAVLWFAAKRILPLILAAALYLFVGSATPALWNKLHPYQQKRLLTFLDPEADPLGSAYQIIQSKIAVGSGGMTGKGFLAGTQTQLKFLPEGHTDFIFSSWGEQFGFVGAFAVTLLFLVIFWRGVRLAARCHNPFYSLTAVGIVGLLTAQAITNLLMTVGLLPVTGVPLPLISYGGSSLIVWMTLAGVLLSISMRWREY